MNPAEMRVEAIRGVLEELLTSSGSDDPKTYAFSAIGEISRILDMEPIEVLDVLTEQEKRRKCPHDLPKGSCPICSDG